MSDNIDTLIAQLEHRAACMETATQELASLVEYLIVSLGGGKSIKWQAEERKALLDRIDRVRTLITDGSPTTTTEA